MWKNLGKTRKPRIVGRCTGILARHIPKQNRTDKYLVASFGFTL